MTISIIVAIAKNRAIGRDNQMPWRLSSDLQFFKQTTMAKPIVMGRKTHQSIGRVLPGRENVIVTRDLSFSVDNCTIVHSLEEALARYPDECFIIGGGELYAQALPLADQVYLTEVDAANIEGDTFFPVLESQEWQTLWTESYPADARNEYAHSRSLLKRLYKIKYIKN